MPDTEAKPAPQWIERKVAVSALTPYERNPRRISQAAFDKLKASLQEMGYHQRILAQPDLRVIGGHQRIKALNELGIHEITVLVPDRVLSDEEFRRLLVQDNLPFGEFDFEMLRADFGFNELENWGMSADWLSAIKPKDKANIGALTERFGIAPFSVFNAREGWWQRRKAAWLAMGLQSELGRGENLLKFSETVQMKKAKTFGTEGNISDKTGTSIFDPVLCEIAYRWFCPPEGAVLDPFAGGSVRGVVAGKLGRSYVGIDLRAEQVEANNQQAAALLPGWPYIKYHQGDSITLGSIIPDNEVYDFVFSCPPYADLEVYSDDPRDLSTMDYDDFLEAYRHIISSACSRLNDDRFAAFVVGEIRDQKGAYRNFVGDTVEAFRDAGLDFYNEAILITMVGSLGMRAGKQFANSRKLGKTHQQFLVFCKGDPKRAAAAVGEVEFQPMGGEEAEFGEPL